MCAQNARTTLFPPAPTLASCAYRTFFCCSRRQALSKPNSVTIECFLDLICPFSRKMWAAVTKEVVPKFGDRVCFVVHQVVQP